MINAILKFTFVKEVSRCASKGLKIAYPTIEPLICYQVIMIEGCI